MKFYVNGFSNHRMPLGPFYPFYSAVAHSNEVLLAEFFFSIASSARFHETKKIDHCLSQVFERETTKTQYETYLLIIVAAC